MKQFVEDDEIAVLSISILDSDGAVLPMLGYFLGQIPLQKNDKLPGI